ncbi:sensor histidine kinase [Flavobacterium sp. W21_SRS_FM6]|uniref:sensor histidine kinase n=1 Tax=Flavobacterium sp. W21_SRS_FM6 TaxID=3240268 RepID=UPI003F904FBA
MFEKLIKNKVYAYIFSFGVVFVFSVLALLLPATILPKSGVLLILQLAVVLVSVTSSRSATALAGILCALIYNYFFTYPLYSLHMFELEDIMNSIIFISVAILTSEFSIRYRKKSEALEQAEIRSNVLLSVSHDLRTPLASIIGSLSTFQEYKHKISEQEQHTLINSAIDESHRLHNYVENLLQLTRLKNNAFNWVFVRQSLWPVIKRLESRFSDQRLSIRKSAPLHAVNIQDALIEQAIYNIVDNALKYSPKEQQVVVEVESDQQFTRVQIKDKGPGIPPEKRLKIFDAFYSGRIGDAGEGGSGIGLSVAKGIVEAHGGRIAVVDGEIGCTIELLLPIGEENV